MFLRKIAELRDSLSAKLTLWYAIAFTLSALLSLIICYQQVLSMAIARVDEELLGDLAEFTDLYASDGIDKVKDELAKEVASEDEERKSIQLLTIQGQVVIQSDVSHWEDRIATERITAAPPKDDRPLIETIDVPSRSIQARTITRQIDPGWILRIGLSLEENDEYLNLFRHVIFILLLPMALCSVAIGWFMAKQALGDVEKITRTAEMITAGNLDERVTVQKKSREIVHLANTFNQMVDKLHTLIRGMREITDNIAHDLRSPLTRIRGIAEMNLLGPRSTEGFESMAVNTVEECDNLLQLINTMLEITETEAGLGMGETEHVDLHALIREASELFHHLALEKQISIIAVPGQSTFVRANRAKLRRLIANLLENGVKYTPADGTITVALLRTEKQVGFSVEDNGIGIAPSDLPKIFNRFYRCDVSRTESGFGLGLSLAKAIAEAMDGDLQALSAPGKGTRFIFSMPSTKIINK